MSASPAATAVPRAPSPRRWPPATPASRSPRSRLPSHHPGPDSRGPSLRPHLRPACARPPRADPAPLRVSPSESSPAGSGQRAALAPTVVLSSRARQEGPPSGSSSPHPRPPRHASARAFPWSAGRFQGPAQGRLLQEAFQTSPSALRCEFPPPSSLHPEPLRRLLTPPEPRAQAHFQAQDPPAFGAHGGASPVRRARSSHRARLGPRMAPSGLAGAGLGLGPGPRESAAAGLPPRCLLTRARAP